MLDRYSRYQVGLTLKDNSSSFSTPFLLLTSMAITEHLLLLIALVWITLDHVCILSLISTTIICQLCDLCNFIALPVYSGFLLSSDSLSILYIGLSRY